MVSQINGSVVNAFRILELFQPGTDQITAATLVARLGMNGITAHRFLRTLELTGALVAVSRGGYQLGYAMADLGERAASQRNLTTVVQPVLEALTNDVNEGSMVTSFDGEMAVCIARAVPARTLFVDIKIGSRLEAYCTAHGKLWLAHLTPEQWALYLDKVSVEPMNDINTQTADSLQRDLAEIRTTGVSYNRGEREPEIQAVGVPAMSRTGRMICGVSIYGPTGRLTPEKLDSYIAPLQAAARKIEVALYGPPPEILTKTK
jgi:DNA-binding IclR family transcriptional regulator